MTTTDPHAGASSMDQVVLDLLEGVALQENALGGILDAEGRKMNAALSLEGLDLPRLLEVNDAAANMVHAVANLELVLKDKLEFIIGSLPYGGGAEDSAPAG